MKCPGGCRRKPSRITAFKYGSFPKSSSFTSSSRNSCRVVIDFIIPSISSKSFCWICGFFTKFAMIHCNVVVVVSVPAFRNSEHKFTISSLLSFLFWSMSCKSINVSTYDTKFSSFSSPSFVISCLVFSRALITGMRTYLRTRTRTDK